MVSAETRVEWPPGRGALSRLVGGAIAGLEAQRGRWFLFVPVLLGIGIGVYFALPREPALTEWAAAGAVACVLGLAARSLPDGLGPLAGAPLIVMVGLGLAGARAHLVAAPVLEWRYFGAVEGRIVQIDRNASDALRLTLDDVMLERISPARTPARVRIALHGQQGFITPEPGMRVILSAHLSPPPGPAEPGGFDFRRLAWFERLGAVGYTRMPVLTLAPADEGAAGLRIHRLRMAISRAVQDRIGGDRGAFAAAILTGDRSGIPQARLEDLRRSNLAHLLAISGLHMGLLTGFVFAALRLVMALVPPFALRAPTRKLAATGALGAGAFYLLLSGGNVATERAFVMVAVMLGAVLLDRRAISLRSIALAGVIILTLRPEALLGAGFQMSFAATIALVAVFGWLRHDRAWRDRVPRWMMPAVSVAICSVVAGLATAPVAAASFNRLAEYGLLANLLAVPLMGTIIMPAAVVAALLSPLGLEGPALAVMGWGIAWVMQVAGFVAGLEGAVVPVVQPGAWVMPIMALGALWLVIWQGRARWAGAGGMALALALWLAEARPDVLIARDGSVVGVMTPDGRAISRASAAAFIAESWLKADGDDAAQATAFARAFDDPRAQVMRLPLPWGGDLVHLSGQGGLRALDEVCQAGGRLVVTSVTPDDRPEACRILSPRELSATGAVALRYTGGKVVTQTATERAGQRPWTPQTRLRGG